MATHETMNAVGIDQAFAADILDDPFGMLGEGISDEEWVTGESSDARAMTISEITQFMLSAEGQNIALFEADDGAPVDQSDAVANEPHAPAIDEGDFVDPVQRALFSILKRHIRAACNVNTTEKSRAAALEWVFVPTVRDKDQIDFDTACLALCARPLIVRARVAHKLWEAGVVLQRPLPFLAALPPASLISEIEALMGGATFQTTHADIARAIWAWPSIHSEELRTQFEHIDREDYVAAINDLLAEGYIGVTAARFYFISRNPANLTQRQREHWQFAASIIGES